MTREEYTEGICAAAVAVRDGSGAAAAISVSAPTARFTRRSDEITAALLDIHRPTTQEDVERAEHRLKWDEALTLQLTLAARRRAASTGLAAAVLAGGSANADGLIEPTVLADVTPEMKVSCLEVFGPVCTVTPYDAVEEAFELANGTEYGLQAGIFTGSVATAMAAGSALEFGGVLVNEAPTFRADQMPYGGVKASGNTKEGPHYSVREMTEERLVVIAR